MRLRPALPCTRPATGESSFAGRRGGYGNALVLAHSNSVSTLYGHMSRFAKHIRVGAHVQQGDVIGYVGMTGLATGPHLHYEYLVNGVHKNPQTVHLAGAEPLRAEALQVPVVVRAAGSRSCPGGRPLRPRLSPLPRRKRARGRAPYPAAADSPAHRRRRPAGLAPRHIRRRRIDRRGFRILPSGGISASGCLRSLAIRVRSTECSLSTPQGFV